MSSDKNHFQILDCQTCAKCCSGLIHVFAGERGSSDSVEKLEHEMPLKDDRTCVYLTEENLCSVYNQNGYSLTCKYYPYYITDKNEMYLAVSCHRYERITRGLIDRNVVLRNGIKSLYNEMVNTVPTHIKQFWTAHVEKMTMKLKIEVDKL